MRLRPCVTSPRSTGWATCTCISNARVSFGGCGADEEEGGAEAASAKSSVDVESSAAVTIERAVTDISSYGLTSNIESPIRKNQVPSRCQTLGATKRLYESSAIPVGLVPNFIAPDGGERRWNPEVSEVTTLPSAPTPSRSFKSGGV